AVFTVAESRDLKKSIPGLHCKCLFLKDDSGKFYLVAIPAEKRLNFNRLRKVLEVRKLHFASEVELFGFLRLKPGSVSIFGLINDTLGIVNFILDKSVWDASFCGFHPNINTSTIVISRGDLERFYNSLNNTKMVVEL
ncbi:MAG: YbaK/EbsC family protein, partial [Nanoarchaeota archaeon]